MIFLIMNSIGDYEEEAQFGFPSFERGTNILDLQGKIIRIEDMITVGIKKTKKIRIFLGAAGGYGINEYPIDFLGEAYVETVQMMAKLERFVIVRVEVTASEWNGKYFVNLKGIDIQPYVKTEKNDNV